jgi:hypothetical protein
MLRTIGFRSLFIVALISMASCKSHLDPADLKNFVTNFASNVGEVTKVDCGKVEGSVGAKTKCTVAFKEGPERTAEVVIVEVLKEQKQLRYEVRFNPELLNRKKVVDYYLDFFPKNRLPITSLLCPSNQEDKVGLTFECVGKLKDGADIKFAASVNKASEVAMNSSSELLDYEKLATIAATWANQDVGKTGVVLDCGKGMTLMTQKPVMCKTNIDGTAFELRADKVGFAWAATAPPHSKSAAK